MPPRALVPAYRIQFPINRSAEVEMIAGLGPPLLRVQITIGLIAQNAKRYPVLNQLIALSETPKYSADVVDIAENVSHCEN